MTRLVALFEALTLLEAVLTGGHMVGSRLWFVYSISRNEKSSSTWGNFEKDHTEYDCKATCQYPAVQTAASVLSPTQ